jgi:hypothetical protein
MEFLYIKTKNQNIEVIKVFDIFDKLVKYFKLSHNKTCINISDLTSIKTTRRNNNIKFLKD